MLSLDDKKWKKLRGGYGVPYNPVPALRKLESGEDAWDDLWDNLHHQGDVGEASYAAVPHLVRIAEGLSERGSDLYALLTTIEIERHRKTNPPVPKWLKKDYDDAWNRLLLLALSDLSSAGDSEIIRHILAAVVVAKGQVKFGAFISHVDEDEMEELLEDWIGWSELY